MEFFWIIEFDLAIADIYFRDDEILIAFPPRVSRILVVGSVFFQVGALAPIPEGIYSVQLWRVNLGIR
jgi:hypothetical protein